MPGVKGRSGRRPKPTALKILQGNPGRRPLHLDREPRPDPAVPECPAELAPIAQTEWRRVSRELHKLGLLSEIDRAALAGYCAAYGRFIEAEAAIQRIGILAAVGNKVVPGPWWRISRDALEIMHRYLTEFGMTPASRSRVRTDILKAAEEVPADEAFLARRGLHLVK